MAIFPVNVDYTARTRRSLLLRLQGLARSVFPKWTDYNTAGWDNILLESMAYVGDVTGFYQDNQAKELFWTNVSQRASAIRLGRHINYVLASARSSTGTGRFYLPSALGGSAPAVPIPLGTIIRTPSPEAIPFRTIVAPDDPISPATIFPTQSYVDVAIEQAEAIQGESFPSTGAPNQRILLTQAPYIDDTSVVNDGTTVDPGSLPWQAVTSFLDVDPNTGQAIGPESKVYVVIPDPLDRAIIIFGDGKSGKIPQGSIIVDYKIGGGVAGNVDADAIIVLDGVINDALSQAAPVRVTNPSATSGGINRETVIQARAQGPRSLRVLERCVTKEDFEITALSVPGIIRSVMVTSNEDGSVQENSGVLLSVASGELLPSGRVAPATPSSTLLTQVLEKVTVEKPPPLTFTLQSFAASFRTIDVSTRVYLEAGQIASDAGEAVRNAVRDFFAALLEDGTANPKIDFGANIKQADGTTISEIAWSDVHNAVNDTTGIRKVDEGAQGLLLNLLRASVSLSPRDFPVVGTIQVIDADTGSGI
jgi:uncharacterized phage protein gp47/JayE